MRRVFNGAMDRFDFKLIGKKEMYVPYSCYRLTYHKPVTDITTPNHVNPDLIAGNCIGSGWWRRR